MSCRKYWWTFPKQIEDGRIVVIDKENFVPGAMVRVEVRLAPVKRRKK